jgi:hypothetical protein
MATLFILLVLAYFLIKTEVNLIEKLVLSTAVVAFAFAPIAWPAVSIAAAIGQGVIGIYIVLRMHYLRTVR